MMRPRSAHVTLALAMTVIAAGCASVPRIDEANLSPRNESTKIFAGDGSLVTTLRQEENREIIPLSQIPKRLRDAVVAIEDSRFYSHKGFDAKAILRALYSNARSGRVVEGGSTITQQLVRNAVSDIGTRKTLERKLKEASYAYQVESSFTKDKILELYLNTVYFGGGAYGVQTAAQTYFRKDVKDVTLAEAAFLAGLIRAPSLYDPYTNAEAALARRNRVLERMVQLGYAPAPDADGARGAELGITPKSEAIRYPFAYFVDYVTRQIQHSKEFSKLGDTVTDRANRLFRGGLRIYTTIDPKVQAAAEESIARVLDRPQTDPSASLVAIDPKDGHVKALVGGGDFFAPKEEDPCVRVGAVNDDGSPKTCAKVNLALGRAGGGSGRQSGSSFKPFVLAAALGKGKRLTDGYPAPSCIDIPAADAGRDWHVCNYEEASYGERMSIRDGTVKSVNTVYAQLIMDVGAAEVVKTAERMGIGESVRDVGIESVLSPVPSAALGTNVVSPLDMASAFTAFPNLGVRYRPVAITKITDARGNVIWRPVERREQVLNPGVAYLSTQVLQEVIERGTAARNGKIGRPAFGKTGTAQEWRDAWFVGGAGTDLVAAVSVFWPDGEIEMKPSCGGASTAYTVKDGKATPPGCRATRIRVTGGSWPTQIWQVFMLKALVGIPASTFPIPQVDVVSVRMDVSRGCLPNPYTPADLIRTLTFIKGTEPGEVCAEPTGPALTTLPSVIGFPEKQAVRLLEQAGFVVTKQPEGSAILPPGYVTRQSPQPGTETTPGSPVTLWISAAATRIVPDVVNLTERDARQRLEKEGFQVTVDRAKACQPYDIRCFVWDQEPNAAARAPEGSTALIAVKPRLGA
ncbi:MAG: transglycosylase domain-containing protein [Actinomycetota bacterium]